MGLGAKCEECSIQTSDNFSVQWSSLQFTSPSSGVCRYCGEKSNHKCSSCKLAKYCSPEHQHLDWAIHKLRCQEQCKLVHMPGRYMGIESFQPTFYFKQGRIAY